MKLKKVKNVFEKMDGSLIQPVLINGKVQMKSKTSFESSQAHLAQKILNDNEELHFFILSMFEQDWYPLFELIGKDNKIVLDYEQNELVLIAIRNEEGSYIDITSVECPVSVAKKFDLSLDECIEICQNPETNQNIEGFVVRFDDGNAVKIKSKWYLENHRIVSDADRNLEVFRMILNDTIDDVLALVSEKRRKEIQEIQDLVVMYVNHYTVQIEDIVKKGDGGDRKTFVEKYKSHPYFGVIMGALKGNNVNEALREVMLKRYNKEQKVNAFLKDLK
jgi:RNA ligase